MSVTTQRVRRDQYSAAVYGSILVAALVGAMFEEQASASTMTLSLAGTVVVFWIAHAWSEVVGERVAEGRLFDTARIKAISLEQWPLVEAGMLPSALLALAWIGLISRHAAVVIALASSIIQLIGWGVVAGRRTQSAWPGALLAGAVDGVLGIEIVALEIAVHR